MNIHQSIPRPNGITVFGSCLVSTDPDIARIHCEINRCQTKAIAAFAEARAAATQVRKVLRELGIPDGEVRTSAITLATAVSGYGKDAVVIGQRATMGFSISLSKLDQLEDILVRIIEAGADRINRVSFHTRKLKELRMKARQRAVAAARRKAELYAQAAEVSVGPVLHIEDVNPRRLNEQGHGEDLDISEKHDDEVGAAGPGSITIAAAVSISFAVLNPS